MRPERKIKWGVIGSGGIARRRTIPEGILPACNAELIAVYDLDAKVNGEVARQYGAIAAESVTALLELPVEAVYIATPANAHHSQVMACARAGKPVLCEKPLGLSVSEATAMIAACHQANVALGAAFMMRFQTQHQAALKLIQDGQLGKPVYGRAQLSCWYPAMPGAWRQDPALGGGGCLIDMGGHCLDLLEMFFGPINKVSCFINNAVHGYPSEDSAVALLHFTNGALATVDTFFCIQDQASKNILELYGSRGGILASGTIGQSSQGEMTAYLPTSDSAYDAQQARSNMPGVKITPPPKNMYQAEIEEFSQALLENRPSSLDALIGLRSQKVLAACYESAKNRKVVEVG